MLRIVLGAALILISSAANAREPFVVLGWADGNIVQGMPRGEVEALLVRNGHELTDGPPFGPTFVYEDREYMLGFCDGVLTSASWLTSDNEQFLRSLSQRVNNEGFAVFRTSVSGQYNDRLNSDYYQLSIELSHPEGDRLYTISYDLYEVNGQITLRDSRYGYNCEPRAPAQ